MVIVCGLGVGDGGSWFDDKMGINHDNNKVNDDEQWWYTVIYAVNHLVNPIATKVAKNHLKTPRLSPTIVEWG